MLFCDEFYLDLPNLPAEMILDIVEYGFIKTRTQGVEKPFQH